MLKNTMSKKTVVVIVAAVLLGAVGFIIAQEGPQRPAGRRGPEGGPARFGPMGEWFENLTKAYEQKDMTKIGQLIEDMKQRRQRPRGFEGGPPRGMRFGQGGPTRGTASGPLDSSPLAKTDTEKNILSVLDDMDRNQRRGMMNVPLEDGRLLRLLTEAANAKHVVEIGTSNGYSGIWLCLALRTTGGKLTTYEINAHRASLARENFKRAGVDDIVTLVEGDAHIEVTKMKEPIDILFLDADKEGYIDYFNKLLPQVRPGGLILAHNVNMRGQMQDFIKAITTDPSLETAFQGRGDGLGVTLKKR